MAEVATQDTFDGIDLELSVVSDEADPISTVGGCSVTADRSATASSSATSDNHFALEAEKDKNDNEDGLISEEQAHEPAVILVHGDEQLASEHLNGDDVTSQLRLPRLKIVLGRNSCMESSGKNSAKHIPSLRIDDEVPDKILGSSKESKAMTHESQKENNLRDLIGKSLVTSHDPWHGF